MMTLITSFVARATFLGHAPSRTGVPTWARFLQVVRKVPPRGSCIHKTASVRAGVTGGARYHGETVGEVSIGRNLKVTLVSLSARCMFCWGRSHNISSSLSSIYKLKKVKWLSSYLVCLSVYLFVSSSPPLVRFGAAVTLCRYTHCQYNESVYRKEQRASWINTIP